MSTVYKRRVLTGGGADALDAIDGAILADGDFAFCMVSGDLYLYDLDASSGAVESSPDVIAPDLNAGTKRWILQRTADKTPAGTIQAFIGGYFGAAGNGSFVNVLGNTVADVNTRLNPDGWYVCDGSALNDPLSPIFNGTGRYLPDLTDDRFLMGDTAAGSVGGDNAMAHTHSVDIAAFTSGATTLTTAQLATHNHAYYWSTTTGSSGMLQSNYQSDGTSQFSPVTAWEGAGNSHTHSVNPPATTSGAASVTENRPKFLSCFYIIKAH